MSGKDIILLNYKHVKLAKYHYNVPKSTDYNSKIVSCLYKSATSGYIRPLFEFPKLKTLSGVYKVNNNYYIDLEIPLETSNNKEKTLYDFLTDNDEHHIITIRDNCGIWFGGQILPLKGIQKMYKSSLHLGKEGRNPYLTLKIPSYRGKILAEIFNQDRELVNMDYINAGDELLSVVEMGGLEFFKNECVGEYEIHKIKVFKNNFNSIPQIPSGYIFSDRPCIDLKKLPDIETTDTQQTETTNENIDELDDEIQENNTNEPIITKNDIVTDIPVIPTGGVTNELDNDKKSVEQESRRELVTDMNNDNDLNEMVDYGEQNEFEDEYYSDSEYDLDDDLDANLIDLSNLQNNSTDNERDKIMNIIRERENELLKLKEQLKVK